MDNFSSVRNSLPLNCAQMDFQSLSMGVFTVFSVNHTAQANQTKFNCSDQNRELHRIPVMSSRP